DAVTVPGAVASWARLVDDHGTMKLADLLQPAIAAAEDGYPVTERVARDWARQGGKLGKNKTAASLFLPGGSAPQPGAVRPAAGARRRATQHRQQWTGGLLPRLDRTRHGRCPARRWRLPHGGRFFRLCAGVCDTDRSQLSRLRGLGMSAKWPGRRPARHAEGARGFRCLRMGTAFGRTLSCADRDRAASLRRSRLLHWRSAHWRGRARGPAIGRALGKTASTRIDGTAHGRSGTLPHS